jgi:DNA repair protein RAD7
MASAEGNGFLCHQCAKASGVDPFKKPKAKPAAKKRETRHIVNFEEKHFPTLVSVCIQVRTCEIKVDVSTHPTPSRSSVNTSMMLKRLEA